MILSRTFSQLHCSSMAISHSVNSWSSDARCWDLAYVSRCSPARKKFRPKCAGEHRRRLTRLAIRRQQRLLPNNHPLKPRQTRQHAYLRGHLQRHQDLPGQGTTQFETIHLYRPSSRLRKNCSDREGIAKLTYNLQGKLYVRGDSKIFRFQNGKTESLFLQRKNPRRIAWTTLYRRMHKKGISEVRHTPCHIIIRIQAPSQTRSGKRDGSTRGHRLT